MKKQQRPFVIEIKRVKRGQDTSPIWANVNLMAASDEILNQLPAIAEAVDPAPAATLAKILEDVSGLARREAEAHAITDSAPAFSLPIELMPEALAQEMVNRPVRFRPHLGHSGTEGARTKAVVNTRQE